MNQQYKSAVAESTQLTRNSHFKFAATGGTFEGYAAVFGNVDNGGDVIQPGAFKQFATTRDGKVRVLYQHDATKPIGTAVVTQDSHGLHVRGELALDDSVAAQVYALMKSGALDSMSIGYGILPGGAQFMQSGERHLSALKLYEVSIVTFGMNEAARISSVKRAAECKSPRELEHLLRENPVFQLSSRKAKAAANALWPILNERDAQTDDREDREKAEQIVTQIQSITSLLKGSK